MNNTIINISKYRGNSSTSYTGRPEGKIARKENNLDQLDRDNNSYKVLIPSGTTAFNPSFFLGFFFESIKFLGLEKFDKKYTIEILDNSDSNRYRVVRDIEEGKRHAKNQMQSKTGFFNFLNL